MTNLGKQHLFSIGMCLTAWMSLTGLTVAAEPAAAKKAPSPAVLKGAPASTKGSPTSPQMPVLAGEIPGSAAKVYPKVIDSMIKKGRQVRVLSEFSAPGGLTGYVLVAGGSEQRIYYVTPDGESAIFGILIDADLNNVTAKHLAENTHPLSPTLAPVMAGPPTPVAAAPEPTSVATAGSESDPATSRPDLTQSGAQFEDSLNLAAQVGADRGVLVQGQGMDVYVVFDPACPFCHKAYAQTLPMLTHLRIHWIPVAELGPRSKLLMQAYLGAEQRATAMEAAMQGQLIAAKEVTGAAAQVMSANAAILRTAGVRNVPLFLYRDEGVARAVVGLPNRKTYEAMLRASLKVKR